MNLNFEEVPQSNPCEAFEHLRGWYIAKGFWRGVTATLLVFLLGTAAIGYALHWNNTANILGVVPPGSPPPEITVVPPLVGGPAPPLSASPPPEPGQKK